MEAPRSSPYKGQERRYVEGTHEKILPVDTRVRAAPRTAVPAVHVEHFIKFFFIKYKKTNKNKFVNLTHFNSICHFTCTTLSLLVLLVLATLFTTTTIVTLVLYINVQRFGTCTHDARI